jgi:hypothetical protein
MWTGLWDTIQQVTENCIKFKFMDSTGLKAILVDSCKPQVDSCGNDLIKQNQSEIMGINTYDPQEIVQYII